MRCLILLILGILSPALVGERPLPTFAVAAVPMARAAVEDELTIDEDTEIVLDGRPVTLAVFTAAEDTEITELVIVGKRITKLVAVTKKK